MADHGVRNTTCSVNFRDENGNRYGYVTSGNTLFDVCRRALERFNDSSAWHGPRPHRETILEVSFVAGGTTWRVKAGTVMEWIAQLTGPDKSTASPH